MPMLRAIAMILLVTLWPGSRAAAQSEPQFKDYPATVVSIQKFATPTLSSESPLWMFRTRVIEGADKISPNFAGHYILIEWGCGTQCQLGAIVDALTGESFPLPPSSLGRAHRLDSSLLIVNPDLSADRTLTARTEYYFWSANKFQQIR
jgi:hypothetical protein